MKKIFLFKNNISVNVKLYNSKLGRSKSTITNAIEVTSNMIVILINLSFHIN